MDSKRWLQDVRTIYLLRSQLGRTSIWLLGGKQFGNVHRVGHGRFRRRKSEANRYRCGLEMMI